MVRAGALQFSKTAILVGHKFKPDLGVQYQHTQCVEYMNSCQHTGLAWFVMCTICVMMTEIYTIEGGEKDVSSLEGTT